MWRQKRAVYWLYIHYTITRADELVERGLRYITVHNGMYVMLDWRIQGRRFTGRDLSAFRARLADLTITESLEEPTRITAWNAHSPRKRRRQRGNQRGNGDCGQHHAETTDGFGKSHAGCCVFHQTENSR